MGMLAEEFHKKRYKNNQDSACFVYVAWNDFTSN